jgi:hypothetical protein
LFWLMLDINVELYRIALVLCILKSSGSNLGLRAGYIDRSFSLPKRIFGEQFVICHDYFIPHHFKIVIPNNFLVLHSTLFKLRVEIAQLNKKIRFF